jgi:general secretion pathway protein F
VALFYYQALTSDNETIEGQMEAASEKNVISKLQEMGYFPISTHIIVDTASAGISLFSKDLSQADVLLITQKLAVMMKAGLTLDRALALLIETTESNAVKAILEKVTVSVHNGEPLSDALQQNSGSFDRFYMNTLRAGETGGSLVTVLERLATHLEQSHAVKKSIQAALMYPIILVAVATVTVLILLIYVVPQFQTMFEDMGQSLPLATQIVIIIAEGIKQYGWIAFIIALALGGLLKHILADAEKRIPIDKLILRLPLVAAIIIRIEVTRFSRSLASLLHNGVPMLSALKVVADSLTNTVIRQAINNVKNSVQEGRGLGLALSKQGIFPPLAVQLIRVGEETGDLVPMLEQVANIYDDELRDSIQRFLTLLEPILIIGLGIIIAGIIISVLLAMLSLNDFAV